MKHFKPSRRYEQECDESRLPHSALFDKMVAEVERQHPDWPLDKVKCVAHLRYTKSHTSILGW